MDSVIEFNDSMMKIRGKLQYKVFNLTNWIPNTMSILSLLVIFFSVAVAAIRMEWVLFEQKIFSPLFLIQLRAFPFPRLTSFRQD